MERWIDLDDEQQDNYDVELQRIEAIQRLAYALERIARALENRKLDLDGE